ncbi:tetratricopeptide repeat protein [Planktothrix agardhii]|uniref:tetratricopeptide repeat protein n=1 Tax=Planktothrix agardhii TaxID=1160 RepID=UPI003C6E2788
MLYHHLANVLAQEQRWSEAVSAFQKTIALYPDHYGTYHGLGQILVKLGKLDDAIYCPVKGK